MKKNEETNTEYYKNGVTYAETYYSLTQKMYQQGMLKMMIGIDEIPNKKQLSKFKLFMDKAKLNANNLCVRDLNEKKRNNPESDLKAFMIGFEKKIQELLEK